MARRYYSFAVAAALLVSGIAVAAAENSAVTPTTGASIRANSNGGLRLFRGATVVTPARVLQTETNTNDDDIPSFLADYSIRYNSCFDRLQFDTTGNIDNNSRDGGEGMLYTAHLVRFSLCPSTSCGPSCENGGEYVISMETFLDAYTESKLNGLEYACEMVRKACDCQDANDDFICESSCYMAAGLTGCEDAEGDGEMFEVQRFMECTGEIRPMGTNADEEYYAGPYCSPNDNFSIMIGMFSDDMCSVQVDSSVYTDVLGYDTELPYSRASVVDTECIDCRLPEDSNSQDDSIIPDVCIAVYYYAARCEEDMKVTNQDNSGCAFLQSMLASDVSAKETPLKNKKKKNKNKKPSKEKKLMYR